MNERNLFRAKRIDNGEWVEGCYAECNGKTFIGINISIYGDIFEVFCTPVIRWFEVDPKTLCQFTGFYDKNGKRIWKNDILMAHLDESYPEDATYETVEWGFAGWVTYEAGSADRQYLDEFDLENFEVVGNIFDNKELLQEEHK
nr:MAG TPA: YopX protein [Caudoviricetes sp.]